MENLWKINLEEKEQFSSQKMMQRNIGSVYLLNQQTISFSDDELRTV